MVRLCDTLSNALAKSIMRRSTLIILLWLDTSSRMEEICVSRDRLCLSPCCRSHRKLTVSRRFTVLLLNICLISLQYIIVRGRSKVYWMVLIPFLDTGATFAWFQSVGTFPDTKDLLNKR